MSTAARHAIVTGGSSGIGAATAEIMAGRGYAVSLIARRPDPLEATRSRIAANDGVAPNRVHAEAADVTDRQSLGLAIERCEAALGPCTTLVCSAGIVSVGRFEDLGRDAFEQTMEVNYFGSLNAVHAVYPGMKARRGGRIVFVSSGAGLIGIYGYTAYSASKFAVGALAEVLRAEARPYGIGVSICHPPDTDTPQLHAERLQRPAPTEAIAGTAPVWSAVDVATALIDGAERGRFAIHPGWQMAALGRFGSLVHPLVCRWFDRVAERTVRDERQGASR